MGYTIREYLTTLRTLPDNIQPDRNMAMEFLANERTLLAWFRTALSIVALGVVITRLSIVVTTNSKIELNSNAGNVIGFVVISLGVFLLLVGFWRYIIVRRYLLDNRFPVSAYSFIILSLIILICFIVILVFLHP